MLEKAYAVIMAGGKGERFWPLSTAARPKQVLSLVGGKPIKQKDLKKKLAAHLKDHAWFLAYAPAADPQIAVSVIVAITSHGAAEVIPLTPGESGVRLELVEGGGELIVVTVSELQLDGVDIEAVARLCKAAGATLVVDYRIYAFDLSVRSAIQCRDEVGELGQAFDEMAGALEQHRVNLQQLVAERTSELESANQELEAFSYSVSHDLRAPLRSINGFGQALLEDNAEQLDEQGKAYLQRIRNATHQMGLLIDDLLDTVYFAITVLDIAEPALELGTIMMRAADRTAGLRAGAGVGGRVGPRTQGHRGTDAHDSVAGDPDRRYRVGRGCARGRAKSA